MVGHAVQKLLIAKPLQRAPRGNRNSILRGKGLVMMGDQHHELVRGGKQCPVFETFPDRHILEEFDPAVRIAFRPTHGPRRVPGRGSNKMPIFAQDPHRYAAAAEASNDAESSVVCAGYDGTPTFRRSVRA